MDIKAKIFNGKVNAELLQDEKHFTLDSDLLMADVVAVVPRDNSYSKLLDLRVITTTGELTIQNVTKFTATGKYDNMERTCRLYTDVPKAKVTKEVMDIINKEYNDIYDKHYEDSKSFSQANAFGTNHVERRIREETEKARTMNLAAVIDYVEETPWQLGKVNEKLAKEIQDNCIVNIIKTVES